MAGEKFLQHDAAGNFLEIEAVQTGGGGSENKVPALDASGRLDATMMPTGIGAETSMLEAYGALAAGDLVNVFDDSGTMKVRKADATNAVAPANAFVLSAYSPAATATVYWAGLITGLTGLTVGPAFLSTTAGATTLTPPSSSGNVVQRVGWIINATTVFFRPQEVITLA